MCASIFLRVVRFRSIGMRVCETALMRSSFAIYWWHEALQSWWFKPPGSDSILFSSISHLHSSPHWNLVFLHSPGEAAFITLCTGRIHFLHRAEETGEIVPKNVANFRIPWMFLLIWNYSIEIRYFASFPFSIQCGFRAFIRMLWRNESVRWIEIWKIAKEFSVWWKSFRFCCEIERNGRNKDDNMDDPPSLGLLHVYISKHALWTDECQTWPPGAICSRTTSTDHPVSSTSRL